VSHPEKTYIVYQLTSSRQEAAMTKKMRVASTALVITASMSLSGLAQASGSAQSQIQHTGISGL
jgi:hypothetical protein